MEYEKINGTIAEFVLNSLVKTGEATPVSVIKSYLYNPEDDGVIRFGLKEYPDWYFGIWVIDKEANEDVMVHVFGTKKEELRGIPFTPWRSSFCASTSFEREELCASLIDACLVVRFMDYLKMIRNSGVFSDWIFNKIETKKWDDWDCAHDYGILRYTIKNYFKKLFKCKKTKKLQKAQKELLLD